MATEISFKEVCRFIKEDNPRLVETVDLVLGFMLILTPVAINTPAITLVPALALLGAKNELTKIGRNLFEWLTKKKETDNLAKHQRMETAYGLLCFTAFFEALDSLLPMIRKEARLKTNDVFELSKGTLFTRGQTSLSEPIPLKRSAMTDYRVILPHPAEDFEAQREMLSGLYKNLSSDFLTFLKETKTWTLIGDDEKRRIEDKTQQLPRLSLKYFDAQYFVLATTYDDFFVWSNLHEQKETRKQITRLSGYLQDYITLADRESKQADIGLANMRDVLNRIPDNAEVERATKVVSELAKFYRSQIQRPMIRDPFEKSGEVRLVYPKKSDIFIPQAFRLLKHAGHQQIGDETSWASKSVRDDLGAFLLSYLSSPYSTQTPLIILGHPGSGKSLLTEILAANLLSTSYTCIRVVLRDVFSDCDITSQVEQQLRKDLGRSVNWVDLADQLGDRPLLIIFDGYDELLQTSGQVISNFLSQLQGFQEREREIRRPVRLIITSRITLIDRAEIPQNSTVIRLEDFDLKKQNEWISIWNRMNSLFFTHRGVRPFVLPTTNPRLLELSRHPLLLLMLAIFDSDGNSLLKNEDLDRTQLYYKLIYRFVERERRKDPSFELLEQSKREKELEIDIERLGVVAIGMFNRKRLQIQETELESDLDLFNLKKDIKPVKLRRLSQAEELAGSFFFIFESRSVRGYGTKSPVVSSTIEFLHNTFGEFLTADFILRQILAVVRSSQILGARNGMAQLKWFTSLMYTPLHTRPVILEMIVEWSKHKLQALQLTEEQFQKSLHTIVMDQTRKLTLGDELATTILPHNLVNEGSSVVGLLATYSLNLIVLELVISRGGFDFHEIDSEPDENRVWDIMTNLWRSWLSPSSLLELSAQMEAYREGLIVHIRPRESKHQYDDPWFESLRKLSSTLADEGLEEVVRALIQTGHYSWR